MAFNTDKLKDDIKNGNVQNIAVVDVREIVFSEDVRMYCEMNSCGQYGKNWACPPGVGPVSDLKAKVERYDKGLVLQTVHPLSDSFDFEGMMAGQKEHEAILEEVSLLVSQKHGIYETLLLGAGPCEVCKQCTYTDGKPCRFPEKKRESLEACGIDVVKLAGDCRIPYKHSGNTVAYIGIILFKDF
ncbi:DUF2284 domain-containing protein [Dethiobacter alkaliphilus]|uniref:DUF2284 domain-containing protein n=1 Tax=Dethiobacter alkaliphilus TaxID=427926 RepID=UPI0022280AF6|nr:DUF2284 domain-containing protein [Dethiobacter alkaliphilus]MCW3490011.1 DUF2284 domain-containing protein [Dethiobacter alkaliphilus]